MDFETHPSCLAGLNKLGIITYFIDSTSVFAGSKKDRSKVKLKLIKPAVGSVFLQKGIIGPLLGDSSIFNNQDPVGLLDGGKPVRDHKNGLALH